MMLSIIAIAAAVLLFAAGPVLTTHQAYACWGGGCFTYGGWGSIRTAASSAPVASAAGKLLPKMKTAQIFFIFAISTD
jgi:hypothetical protein